MSGSYWVRDTAQHQLKIENTLKISYDQIRSYKILVLAGLAQQAVMITGDISARRAEYRQSGIRI